METSDLLYALASAVLVKAAMFKGMRMPKIPKGRAPASAGPNTMAQRALRLKIGEEQEHRAPRPKPSRLQKVWKAVKSRALPAAGLAALYAATGDGPIKNRIAGGFANAAVDETEWRLKNRLFS